MPTNDFVPAPFAIPLASIVAGAAVLFGIALFSFGFWLAWHPLGPIAGGLSISAVGILLGRQRRPVRRQP